MAYAEKRDGKLTGKWLGEHHSKAHGRFKRAFDTKKAADAYEAYVALMGTEPPVIRDGKQMAPKGRSFREIAEQCKAAGGPRGAWLAGKDRSGMQRLEFVIDVLGTYDIDDITRSLVRDKLLARVKGCKQGTLNRYTSAVSSVLTWACNEDIIRSKPTLEFKQEKDKTKRNVVPFDVEDRICAWLAAKGLRVHAAVVRWLAATGMRLGELYKLRPEQIETDHLVLDPDQTKGDRPRLVYVPPELCREMRAIIAAKSLPEQTQLRRKFKEAFTAAGSEKHLVLHGLRHSRNTRMRKAGVSQALRKKILGHLSDEVNDGYDHVDLDDQRKAAAMVEQLRGETVGNIVNLADHARAAQQGNADETDTSDDVVSPRSDAG